MNRFRSGISRATACLAGLGATWLLTACLELRVADPDKSGNSSETVAMGKVVDAQGHSVMGARVALVPEDFNPVKESLPNGLMAVTDAKGGFSIPRVPRGRYGLEATHPSDGTRAFAGDLDLTEASSTLPEDTLREPGRIRVRLPEYITKPGGYVFLPQTRFAWPVTGTAIEHGYLDLDSLPASEYAALVFTEDGGAKNADTLGRDLEVLPGDSIILGGYAGWVRHAKVTLNTASAGNALEAAVTWFPVLVRLSAANFDFASAASDGADLRFSRNDGTPVPYQIDHWDAARKEAAVWVVVDTVKPSDAEQSFLMHWGKGGAVSRSDGAAVFGASGFAAAWHLEEEKAGVGSAGVYRNSAANANHGLDSLSSTDRGGVIGYGHFFNGREYIRVPTATAELKPAKAVTISAWIKPTATDSSGAEIATMGNDYGLRVMPGGDAYAFSFNEPRTDSSNSLVNTTGVNLMDGRWHHFAGIIQDKRLEIYLDGAFAIGKDCPAGALKYDAGPDFFFGHHGHDETKYDYTGYIDEVNVRPGVSTAAWLRLAYLNQKADATLVKITPLP
jgi:hypothetical protein